MADAIFETGFVELDSVPAHTTFLAVGVNFFFFGDDRQFGCSIVPIDGELLVAGEGTGDILTDQLAQLFFGTLRRRSDRDGRSDAWFQSAESRVNFAGPIEQVLDDSVVQPLVLWAKRDSEVGVISLHEKNKSFILVGGRCGADALQEAVAL